MAGGLDLGFVPIPDPRNAALMTTVFGQCLESVL